jgi:hypothetical protein
VAIDKQFDVTTGLNFPHLLAYIANVVIEILHHTGLKDEHLHYTIDLLIYTDTLMLFIFAEKLIHFCIVLLHKVVILFDCKLIGLLVFLCLFLDIFGSGLIIGYLACCFSFLSFVN